LLLEALLDELLELAELRVQVAAAVLLVGARCLRDQNVDVRQQHPAQERVTQQPSAQ
jgi:hypothetical protein